MEHTSAIPCDYSCFSQRLGADAIATLSATGYTVVDGMFGDAWASGLMCLRLWVDGMFGDAWASAQP